LLQVTLTEYVKMTESIYKIETASKCPDDQFVHDRVVNFEVSSTSFFIQALNTKLQN